MNEFPVFLNDERFRELSRARTRSALSRDDFQRRRSVALAVLSTFQSARTLADLLHYLGDNPTRPTVEQLAVAERLEREISSAFESYVGVDLISAITKGTS